MCIGLREAKGIAACVVGSWQRTTRVTGYAAIAVCFTISVCLTISDLKSARRGTLQAVGFASKIALSPSHRSGSDDRHHRSRVIRVAPQFCRSSSPLASPSLIHHPSPSASLAHIPDTFSLSHTYQHDQVASYVAAGRLSVLVCMFFHCRSSESVGETERHHDRDLPFWTTQR